MYSMFRTPEREPLYKRVGPIAEEAIHPYQLVGTPPVDSLEQLRQAPQITTRHAGLIPDVLEAQGFGNLDKSATSSQQLYRMLLAGRTGIIVGDTDAGVAYYSAQLGIARARCGGCRSRCSARRCTSSSARTVTTPRSPPGLRPSISCAPVASWRVFSSVTLSRWRMIGYLEPGSADQPYR